jgi:hypothetical protein
MEIELLSLWGNEYLFLRIPVSSLNYYGSCHYVMYEINSITDI